ncbi:MAG TPA: DNA-3-methyladenine glycosylase 2 family protein [Ignavibacteriales bacterium]|nr:DNA-3-methyladenine glycosylase 2 family protein [Ignavibacteriales bacterium]
MFLIVNNPNIKSLVSTHKIFSNIKDKYGAPPNWQRPQGYVSLSRIILEQQISLASAEAHFIKLNNYIPEFSPTEILKLTDEEMRACQISRQKNKYLRELSSAVLNKDLVFEELSKLSPTEVRRKLTSIKGIGDWTTDIYLMFCLQSKDIFPLGDIALITTIRELTKVKTKSGIVRLTKKWKPLRSLAAYFLWHYYLKKRNRN